jgi:pyrroline-5-carboxylate reductase
MSKNQIYQMGFIGCGKMAQIILSAGLKTRRFKSNEVVVSRRNISELKKIRRQWRVSTTTDNTEVARSSRIIWLGIKPFQAQTVLEEIATALRPGAIIVSMMAGISTKRIQKILGPIPVLRIMPNTPAQLGQGVTAAYFTPKFPKKIQKKLLHLLEGLGSVVLLKDQNLFDPVTGLSGSGPAFVYAIAQGFITGGIQAGLGKDQARALAVQTLLGAAAMLKETGRDPGELIAQVVSKGGTTEAGLRVLKKNRVERGVTGAVRASAKRSREISRKMR